MEESFREYLRQLFNNKTGAELETAIDELEVYVEKAGITEEVMA